MKANNRKWFREKGLWIATFIPLFLTFVILPFLPENLPAHYDMNGNIDRWGSKYEQLILPIIIIILSLFWKVFINYYKKKELSSKTDKERQEASNNKKVIYLVAIGMAIMFTFMHIAFIYSAIITVIESGNTSHLDINIVSNVSSGMFIIAIGLYFTVKCYKSSDKIIRFEGKALVIVGILIIIQALLLGGMISTFVTIALLLLTGIITTIKYFF